MKPYLLVLLISILNIGNINAKKYYVSASGNNSNSGLSTSLAWRTLTYAAGSTSPVTAGDTVYIKSGNYGAENVVFKKSGTATKSIVFAGYKTTPGDAPPLLVNNANPYAAFLSNDMPTFDGGNRSSGIGFNCDNQRYLVIKNFQLRNYEYGLIAGYTTQTAGNLVLDNINMMSLGDINASYSGEGILLGSMGTKFSNNNTLTNCLVVNASAEGFGVNGDNNTLTGCKIYCNENTTNNASTDYYIIVCGSYNTITSCYVERAAGLWHTGHGIGVKSNAEQVIDQGLALPAISPQYNKFNYNTAKNMGESFYVRHRTVKNNTFYHCKAIGTHTGVKGSSEGEGNCIVTRDGASNNTFDGCIAENCKSGFVFVDTVEDGDTGTNPPGHPGNNNKYINCLIYNCYLGVHLSDYGVQSDAGDNTIANCTFYKTRYLHYAARHCANMKYVGNIYYGCLPTASGGYFKGNTYAGDVLPNGINTYFKNCDFINIEGGMPLNFIANSIGSIAMDPLFVNPTAADFHLKPTSPCRDKSLTLSTVTDDFDGYSRPQGGAHDIGAYEYQVTTSVSGIQASSSAVQVYPNPTSGVLNVVTENDNNTITVFDLLGKVLYKIKAAPMKTEIDLQGYKNGIYFVLVVTADLEKTTIKLILSK